MRYELIVGNIGTVLRTKSEAVALREFEEWRKISLELYCRCSNEEVTLLLDGEPIREYVPEEQTQ